MSKSEWTKAGGSTTARQGQEHFPLRKFTKRVKWLYTNFNVPDNQQQILTESFYKTSNAYERGWTTGSSFTGIKRQLSVTD